MRLRLRIVAASLSVLGGAAACSPPPPSGGATGPASMPLIVQVASPTRPGGKCSSFGSGFFVSIQGDIVTSGHVIKGCQRLAVRASDGTVYLGRPIAADPRYDVAVVRVNGEIPATAVISLAPPRPREAVTAVGFPDDRDSRIGPTAARGSVLDHPAAARDEGLLAFAASLVQGNSGGPVIDQSGQVVGVVFGRYNHGKDVYFAVRAQVAMRLLDQLSVRYRAASSSTRIGVESAFQQAAKYMVFIQCIS